MNSPIALFIYNRLAHTKATVAAIQACSQAVDSDLYIFCDGPKINASNDEVDAINTLRAFANEITGFKSVQIIAQKSNLGLSKSIVQGITNVLEKHESVIVLEDDIVVGKDFLNYMNTALLKYEHEPKVAGISGYSFPIKETQPYFSRTGSCWGWATYKSVWDDFRCNRENLNLNDIDANELDLFNVFGTVYTSMFLQTKQGSIQSWAVEFYLYYFSKKQYFLMPGINLIENAGFDGTGTHKTNGNFLTNNNAVGQLSKLNFPAEITEDPKIRKKIIALYHQGYARSTWISSFVNKIKRLLLANENNNH